MVAVGQAGTAEPKRELLGSQLCLLEVPRQTPPTAPPHTTEGEPRVTGAQPDYTSHASRASRGEGGGGGAEGQGGCGGGGDDGGRRGSAGLTNTTYLAPPSS